MILVAAIVALLWAAIARPRIPERQLPNIPRTTERVRVQTELGDIVVEVDAAKAPATAANFLRYVDGGHYDGGTWHRTVKMDNQPESTIKIEVIQAGVNPDKAKSGFPAIALERTSVTGLLHKDGVISMARGAPDSATSGWFICINDQPSLDFGGLRNPDGQGFAAFGRVVSGMESSARFKRRHRRPTHHRAQRLTPRSRSSRWLACPWDGGVTCQSPVAERFRSRYRE